MTSFDKILEHEIDTANDHLPAKRVSLKEILQSGDYSYTTRGGEKSSFRIEEVEYLKALIPENLQDDVRLPLVILRRMDLGQGIFSISGGKVELFLVYGIIDDKEGIEWDDLVLWEPVERYVRPQVQLLRRKFPSATVIGFTLTPTNNDNRK